jgi:hypothetical protein
LPGAFGEDSTAKDDFPDDFGDDFDEFGEGGEQDDDDDFGDFGDDFGETQDQSLEAPIPDPEPPLQSATFVPMLQFENLRSRDSVATAVEEILSKVFSFDEKSQLPPVEPLSKDSSIFLSERR